MRLAIVVSFCALIVSCGDTAILGPPAAATGLTATTSSNTEIVLSWSATNGALSYRVYRGALLLPAVVTGTSFTDTGLSPVTAYAYTVSACAAADGTQCGGQSASASATTKATVIPASGLIGTWQLPSVQIPSLKLTFAAENASSGSGTLGVPPTAAVVGQPTPLYTGDNFIITSGTNNGTTVTFSGTLGNNGCGPGCIGTISFSGTLNGTTLTGLVNYKPPNTETQGFAAATASFVLTKSP